MPMSPSRISHTRPTRRPCGYTLVEMLIVCAVLAALAGLSWPALRGTLAKARLQQAADDLQTTLRKTRTRAISGGEPIALQYEPGGRRYRVGEWDVLLAPFDEESLPAAPETATESSRSTAGFAPTVNGRPGRTRTSCGRPLCLGRTRSTRIHRQCDGGQRLGACTIGGTHYPAPVGRSDRISSERPLRRRGCSGSSMNDNFVSTSACADCPASSRLRRRSASARSSTGRNEQPPTITGWRHDTDAVCYVDLSISSLCHGCVSRAAVRGRPNRLRVGDPKHAERASTPHTTSIVRQF